MSTSSNKRSTPKKNVDLAWVMKYLKDGVYPQGLNFSEKRMVRKRAERFCFWKDELYYLGTPTDQSLGKKTRKVLMSEDEQWNMVEQCHVDEEGTHLGLERTAENIIAQYHWNGIYKFIKNYIRQCKVCLERHPKMFSKRCASEDREESGEVEGGEETDSGAEHENQDEGGVKFWSKVELRVFGPYNVSTSGSNRMILVAVDCFSKWVECFVLNIISADSVANSLLLMICRHGKMEGLVVSSDSSQLFESTKVALNSLDNDSSINIPLYTESQSDTGKVFRKAEGLITDFVTKNPETWTEKIDLCLQPLRKSKPKSNTDRNTQQKSNVSITIEEEMNTAAEALMSVHKAQSNTPVSTPVIITPNTRGIVTRSRTGNTKPKPFDDSDYEVPSMKRKVSINIIQSSPVRKKAKTDTVVSPETPIIDINEEVGPLPEVVDDTVNSKGPVKKIVDLDTYYLALRNFLSGNEFEENTSTSFKRLVKEQSKNYCLQNGVLYNIFGPDKDLKKVVMTKSERLDLMTKSLHTIIGKPLKLHLLEESQWKGKMMDCDVFLLACPHNDKLDMSKQLKDVNTKTVAESKKQMLYDTDETYQEISNYIIYDVFSDDEASKRLEYLQRQIKNFKMEDGELVHVTGSKKHKILLTAKQRLAAIAEAHTKRGQHSDVTTTYHQLAESSFWFGMKFDVKIYVNLCCQNENKHILESYFLFREHLMKESSKQKSEDYVDDDIEQSSSDVELKHLEIPTSEEIYENIVEEAVVNVSTTSPVKPTGIFVSSMKYIGEPSTATSKVTMETTDTPVTVASDTSKQMDVNNTLEVTQVDEIEMPGSTILVKITDDGQAVIMREDGTDPTTDEQLTEMVNTSNTTTAADDVTTAVKSILTETETINMLYKSNETVSTELPQTGRSTAEEGTNTEIVDDGESDSWMYGSDDDDDDDIMDDEPSYSVLESIMQNNGSGEKKQVTPRPNFKCNQCNKIFYGPLKFKMHMYKHTGQKPFPCNLCNKKYTNKKSLVLHQKTHTGELPYACSLCGKRCPSKISLKSHLKCHDGNGGGFPAKCDICERMFSRKHLMERHKLHKHTNLQTEFRCNECNKVFSHQRSLKRHFMSTHLNIKNHACGLCGKSFYRKEYLTGHLIQHGGAAAEGLTPRKPRPSTFKPRPSVFNQTAFHMKDSRNSRNVEQYVALQDDQKDDEGVERIILTQDEDGQYRVVDLATEREVKRMLEARGINRGEAGETMVVHIEEPSGESQVVHVEHTEEQVVEVPLDEHTYIEYQHVTGDDKTQEFVISEPEGAGASGSHYIYTSSSNDASMTGNQELVYGQPAVQYEVECVGDVGDEEALSAINLLAQASAQQYENVISQI